jgi:hypothetical protein
MKKVNGILVLYDHPLRPDAPTIMEHVDAFERHSRFPVWSVNTALGFPKTLGELDFGVIMLHYSLFGWVPFKLDEYFERYLAQSRAYKIAFFQDEFQFCRERFAFLDRYDVDCVYTLLEESEWAAVYRRHTSVRKLVYTIPGYVSADLVARANEKTRPDAERQIDIGYRTRTLWPTVGRGGLEKVEIGRRFAELARTSGLKLDIALDEESRIYGPAWFDFVANCRGVLGVEAGVSIFDTTGEVHDAYERLIEAEPAIGIGELRERLLDRWEDNIYYRTISPRHFEAAAFRVCQILFEGKYSGILEPMVHYLPLKKDFSNFDEVIRGFRDPELRQTLTDNAHRDLIASGAYTYERFVQSFDDELLAAGLSPAVDERLAAAVTNGLAHHRRRRELRAATIGRQFRGREQLVRPVRPLLRSLRRRKLRRWKRNIAPNAEG